MSESEIVTTPSVEATKVRKALARPQATVSDVLKAVVPEAQLVTLDRTPLPKDPSLNEEAWESIQQVAALLGDLKLPDRRRVMTDQELEQVTRTYDALQTAIAGLNRSRDQIKTAAFNHADAIAAEDGRITVDTHHTREGWAVLEDKESFAVEGLDVKLTREVSGGKTTLSVDGLRNLVEDEKIDQTDLLSMTRQIRVLDEDRALAWIRKNPEKAHLLVEATTTSKPTASFWLRSND